MAPRILCHMHYTKHTLQSYHSYIVEAIALAVRKVTQLWSDLSFCIDL